MLDAVPLRFDFGLTIEGHRSTDLNVIDNSTKGAKIIFGPGGSPSGPRSAGVTCPTSPGTRRSQITQPRKIPKTRRFRNCVHRRFRRLTADVIECGQLSLTQAPGLLILG